MKDKGLALSEGAAKRFSQASSSSSRGGALHPASDDGLMGLGENGGGCVWVVGDLRTTSDGGRLAPSLVRLAQRKTARLRLRSLAPPHFPGQTALAPTSSVLRSRGGKTCAPMNKWPEISFDASPLALPLFLFFFFPLDPDPNLCHRSSDSLLGSQQKTQEVALLQSVSEPPFSPTALLFFIPLLSMGYPSAQPGYRCQWRVFAGRGASVLPQPAAASIHHCAARRWSIPPQPQQLCQFTPSSKPRRYRCSAIAQGDHDTRGHASARIDIMTVAGNCVSELVRGPGWKFSVRRPAVAPLTPSRHMRGTELSLRKIPLHLK